MAADQKTSFGLAGVEKGRTDVETKGFEIQSGLKKPRH